jgi:hypothetical protein
LGERSHLNFASQYGQIFTAVNLKAYHLIRFGKQPVQVLLIRPPQPAVFIHTVDGHGLLSGQKHALAQGEDLGLFFYGKAFTVSLQIPNSRTVQKYGHIIVVVEHQVSESESVP